MRNPARAYRRYLRCQVVVSRVGGRPDVQGVLYRADGPLLVLRKAQLVKDTPVRQAGELLGHPELSAESDGDFIIERAHLDFIVALPQPPMLG